MNKVEIVVGNYPVTIDEVDYKRLLEYKDLDEDAQVAMEYYFSQKYLWNCLMFDEVYSRIE